MTSCATVFCGSKKMVTFDSNLTSESATLTVDGRKYTNVKFPYSMKVKRGFNDTVVKAEAEGYAPVMLVIEKTFNAVSVINLGNVLAWGIDAATGAMMKPEFDYYQIDFEKEAPGK
ncbi:MAG: hypothetical protein K2F95_02355 [Alistipes sp.]|nr:hypothetical protein [Alistipes sp.]MDE7129921.1 hypothetical protein [Alistipes sp.]